MSDELSRSSRRQIEDDFNEAIQLLLEWKSITMKIRDIIETPMDHAELDKAHRAQEECRNRLIACVVGL